MSKFSGKKALWRGSGVMRLKAAFMAAMMLVALPGAAVALDVDADDYGAGALPAGTNLGVFYYQYANRDKLYQNGNAVGPGNLESNIGILRYARFVEIGPFLADPQFLLPIGKIAGTGGQSGLGSDFAVGDLILASTVWLYRNKEQGQYFGITPIVYIPSGAYDNSRSINLGENRWKGAIQAGYSTQLFSKDLVFQITADVTFFGDNTNFGPTGMTMSQDPVGLFQGWLKYNFSPNFDVRVGLNYSVGGETRVNGISNDDKLSNSNFRAGFSYSFLESYNFMALYGRDIHVESGFKESDRINLRLMHVF